MVSTRSKSGKSYEISRDGFIRVYPSLHETKEKGYLRFVMKLLKRLKKGH